MNDVERLERRITNPGQGLPEDIFQLVSRVTPLVNVDLLIRDDSGRILLTWRDDGFFPPGWHIPGGIIRYKEALAERIRKTAMDELGATVSFGEKPLAVNESFTERRTRGHFISFLYECRLVSGPDPELRYTSGAPSRGVFAWFLEQPEDFLDVHRKLYSKYFN